MQIGIVTRAPVDITTSGFSLKNIFKVFIIFLREKPDVVISTGALVTIPI